MARHLPVMQMRSSIRGDGERNTVHPADVSGRFNKLRIAIFVVLMAVYLTLPWVQMGGHPAVLLDIAQRRFYLFGSVFNAQDVWLTFFILSGVGFALVAVTAVAGRVWCGYACPQTVFLEGIFRPIQRFMEGPREKRMRRESGPWTAERIARRVALWSVYAALSLAVAHMFLGYFTPIRELWTLIKAGPAESPQAFAIVVVFAAATFFNFAWFREQVCVAICPYGRLQSVLTDPDSLVIGYDEGRGEPRTRGKEKAEGVGDCVDCNRCVVVCPTGIDIRNGLQLDCVACARCVDACDEVMDRLGRPRGLVRYDSFHGLHAQPKRFFRPRIYLYIVLGLMGLVAASFAFRRHTTFEANVLRLPGAPYVLDNDLVRNAYNVHLVNKQSRRVTFGLEGIAADGVSFVIPLSSMSIESLGATNAPVFVTLPRARYRGGFTVRMRVRVLAGGDGGPETERVIEAPFLGPSR